jgi:hypothetical protein
MAAPINNKFWKARSRHGRDKIFKTPDCLWDGACEYFQMCDDNPDYEVKIFQFQGEIVEGKLPKKMPYTLEGLTLFLNVNRKYLDDLTDDFSLVVEQIKQTCHNQKLTGAAQGFFDSGIIARDLGLRDKTDNEHNVNIDSKISLNVNFKNFGADESKSK